MRPILAEEVPFDAQLTEEEMAIHRIWDKAEDWDSDAVYAQLKELALRAGRKVVAYYMHQGEDKVQP